MIRVSLRMDILSLIFKDLIEVGNGDNLNIYDSKNLVKAIKKGATEGVVIEVGVFNENMVLDRLNLVPQAIRLEHLILNFSFAVILIGLVRQDMDL